MVGAGEVDEDLEAETKEECEKYGKVGKCVIFEVRGFSFDVCNPSCNWQITTHFQPVETRCAVSVFLGPEGDRCSLVTLLLQGYNNFKHNDKKDFKFFWWRNKMFHFMIEV